jgi:hypothetical protein
MIRLSIAHLQMQQWEKQMSPCLPEVLPHLFIYIGPHPVMLAVSVDTQGE